MAPQRQTLASQLATIGRLDFSTPFLPRAFLNDHATDESAFLFVEFAPAQTRTILDG